MSLRQISVEPPCRPLNPVPFPGTRRAETVGHAFPLHPECAAAQLYATDRRTVAAGVDLVSEFDTCDSVFIVLSGWMALKRILEDGRQQILDFVLPGSIVGNPTGAAVMSHSIEALTDTEVAVIPQSRIPEMMSAAPSAAMALLTSAQRALANAYDSLTDIGRRSAREAVASFLLRMERRIRDACGERADGSLEFPLTQENIGDALGLTAVHVCRTLRALSKEGVVCAGRKGLVVRDRAALAEIAGAEPEFGEEALPARYALAH